MTHVSSKKLNKDLSDKIFRKFLSVLYERRDKESFSLVIHELFTRTEKIMLAKRLAIILLLSDNIPQHRITEVLNVSPTTVAKASLKIEIGKYKKTLKVSKKEKADLEELVSGILTVGGIMPPKVGKRYWRKQRKS